MAPVEDHRSTADPCELCQHCPRLYFPVSFHPAIISLAPPLCAVRFPNRSPLSRRLCGRLSGRINLNSPRRMSDHSPHHRLVRPRLSILASRRKAAKLCFRYQIVSSLSGAYERPIIRTALPLLTVLISHGCVSYPPCSLFVQSCRDT